MLWGEWLDSLKKKNKCGMNTNVSKRDLEYF